MWITAVELATAEWMDAEMLQKEELQTITNGNDDGYLSCQRPLST